MNKILFVVTFVLLTASVAVAQTPALTGEMKNLEFLVGEWKGEGWQLRPDGSKENSFKQQLKVKIKDASFLRISESRNYKTIISKGKDTIFIPGTPVFHSSSLEARIYYDDKVKLYLWAGETSYGKKNPMELKLSGRTLQYGIPFSIPFQPSERNRRITIEITEAGEWHETLEVWHLGRWFLVEESTLKKVK